MWLWWVSAFCRCNFLLNKVIDKILLLTRRREKYLVVGAVRFVRTILSRHVCLNILFCLWQLSEWRPPSPTLYMYQSNLDIPPWVCNFRVHMGLIALYQVQIAQSPSLNHYRMNLVTWVFIFKEVFLLICFFFRVRQYWIVVQVI